MVTSRGLADPTEEWSGEVAGGRMSERVDQHADMGTRFELTRDAEQPEYLGLKARQSTGKTAESSFPMWWNHS